jgi:hypothetical protein
MFPTIRKQQQVVEKILNGKLRIACKEFIEKIFFVLLSLFILFSNLFKGMDRINLEVYDQVSLLPLK